MRALRTGFAAVFRRFSTPRSFPSGSRESPHERLPYIDGLRAIAVLSVVVYHGWKYSGDSGQTPLGRALQMGAHGVDLFFVLSGFCLAYPYLSRVRAQGFARFAPAVFAAKRITRIVPPYWLALMVCVLLGLFGVLPAPPPPLEILKQLVFLDGNIHFVAGQFWTLPVEFRWYFLFPAALVAYVRAPRLVLAAAVAAYILYDHSRMAGIPDFGALPAFLAGIWVADLQLKRSLLQRLALPVFVLYGIMAFALEPNDTRQFYGVEPLGVGAALAFVALAGTFKPLRWLLSHPIFTKIGAASYGIYLLHDPIVKQLETIDRVAPPLACLAAVAISFGFSWLCEQPFVSGELRAPIVRFLEVRLRAFFAWLGLPASILMAEQSPAVASDVEAEKVA
jgi:peptidoglycan/LPS O-acetylase OafA/YrhL